MQGDFSRVTFDSIKHFSRVLMQQGRVQLDSDWNEQMDILLHLIRMLAADLIGDHGGPDRRPKNAKNEPTNTEPMDFEVMPADEKGKLQIGAGHYYVGGILLEHEQTLSFSPKDIYAENHPGVYELEIGMPYLLHVDVWERHLTYYEDSSSPLMPSTPTFREVALCGPDTASRAQVVWRPLLEKLDGNLFGAPPKSRYDWRNRVNKKWHTWTRFWHPASTGRLKAKAKSGQDTEACLTPPDSSYRGAENQLYRVEIHTGGEAGQATFKWSRENGSVIFPVRSIDDNVVTLETLGQDGTLGLERGDWVEIIDDTLALSGRPGKLAQVSVVTPDDYQVTVETTDKSKLAPYGEGDYLAQHVLLRRWDHKRIKQIGSEGLLPIPADDGALNLEEDKWLWLEKGVQVNFPKIAAGTMYNPGDYWLIPARVVTGDVEWPYDPASGEPLGVEARGIKHFYAPLAIVSIDANGNFDPLIDCRHLYAPLAK